MGPGRLPYHHRRVLHYCHDLDVALEIYVMETTANLFQTDTAFGGRELPRRRIANDTHDSVAELFAKCVGAAGVLDQELHEGDRERLLSLLKVYGDLGQGQGCTEWDYCGSTRSGCAEPLTVAQPCQAEPPLLLHDLLQSNFW